LFAAQTATVRIPSSWPTSSGINVVEYRRISKPFLKPKSRILCILWDIDIATTLDSNVARQELCFGVCDTIIFAMEVTCQDRRPASANEHEAPFQAIVPKIVPNSEHKDKSKKALAP
jgi:hypothetical protein